MNDDMEIVELFEDTIAKYIGSKYGVAVSSGTNAIFLALLYLKSINELRDGDIIKIPSQTYISVPMAISNAGLKVKFIDNKWIGNYKLEPTNIYDSSVKFIQDMYIHDSYFIVSFQYRKGLPIGRGGMILTDDLQAVRWLKQARHNGRHEDKTKFNDMYEMIGWDMYMTPEQASRGITLFSSVNKKNIEAGSYKDYPDVSEQMIGGWK